MTILISMMNFLNNKATIVNFKTSLFFVIVLVAFSACKKDTVSVIGNDILPDGDKFAVKYHVFKNNDAITVKGKRFISNNRDYALLGSYTLDDKLGLVTADFITQVRASSLSIDFADSILVDSVKLFLSFNDEKYYGEENTEFKFSIYELNQTIYFDSTYYTDFNASAIIESNSICDTTYTPNTNDEIIEFSLNTNYGQKIIDAYKTTSFSDNDDFVKVIQGLYIKTDSITTGGSVLYFDYKSANSFIKIYYTETKSGVETAQDFDLVINNYCAEINMFHHTYGNIEFNDTTDFVYAQGMSGAMGKLDLSFVKSFADSGKIVINKAELIIPNENDVTYGSPANIYIEIIDETSINTLVKTGYLNDEGTEYSFVITKHVKSIIDGVETKTGVYIYPANPTINASRIKLINNFDNKSIELKLTYTKY